MNIELQQAAILHNLRRRGLELKDFGKSLGLSTKSGYSRFSHPEKLTVEDLHLMHADLTEIKELTGVTE